MVSLNKIVKWMGGLVEAAGVNLFTQFGGASLIYEGQGIAGVITEDKGVDKNGKPKDNYTPGYELRAKVTVLAEGTRGSLTKQLVEKKNLANINPQTYGLGIKELWDVQPDRIQPGFVAHTLGWPISTDMYGGGWIYGLSNNRVSIGLVVALEYADPRIRSRTPLFKRGRPTRTSKKFWRAANWCVTAQNRCRMAAGTPCREII